MDGVWEKVVEKLEERFGEEAVRLGLHRFRLRRSSTGRWTLEAPDPYLLGCLDLTFRNRVLEALREEVGPDAEIELRARSGFSSRYRGGGRHRRLARSTALCDRLCVDEGNRQAVLAVRGLVQSPREFSPMFLFGPTSSGKTHLLRWVERRLRRGGCVPLMLQPRRLQAAVGLAHKEGKPSPLRTWSETAEAVILDEAHLLANKRQTQRELGFAFKRWMERGVPIVVASRLHPKQIDHLDPVVATILLSGFLVHLHALSSRLRAKILQRRLLSGGRRIPREKLDEIVPNLTGPLDAQERCLVDWLSSGGSTQPSLPAQRPTTDAIVGWVAERFGVSKSQIYSGGKVRSVRFPRRLLMYWLVEREGKSFAEVAELFGYKALRSVRDHAASIRQEMRHDSDIARWVVALESFVEGFEPPFQQEAGA